MTDEATPLQQRARRHTRPIPNCQAVRIFEKFGGPLRLFSALKVVGAPVGISSIYRWSYPKEVGGTGGHIPPRSWSAILLAAKLEGVLITSEDMDPRTASTDKVVS